MLDSYFLQAATKKQKYEKISEKKMSTPVEVLCKVSVHNEYYFKMVQGWKGAFYLPTLGLKHLIR
jgi:hypothetical protein